MTHRYHKKEYSGILGGLKIRLQKNRLGELLVLNGAITPNELKLALATAKHSGKALGHILVEDQLVSRSMVRKTLAQQMALRFTMGCLTAVLSFSGMGLLGKSARAGSIQDVPGRVAFEQVAAYAPLHAYPALFGSSEKQSTSLSAFTKWQDMFDRLDSELNTRSGQDSMMDFKNRISDLKGLSIGAMAVGVNRVVNQIPYIGDNKIYGKNDFWATPVEFMRNGGDCEDFAIAKYVGLRMLGVPENRLRIMVLQDMQKNIPHAILIVYTENGPVLLDNQIKTVTPVQNVAHYKPIFSINRDSWWLHTKPKSDVTVVASSSQ